MKSGFSSNYSLQHDSARLKVKSWCREGESNPQGTKYRRILSPLRLPVPPSRLERYVCGTLRLIEKFHIFNVHPLLGKFLAAECGRLRAVSAQTRWRNSDFRRSLRSARPAWMGVLWGATDREVRRLVGSGISLVACLMNSNWPSAYCEYLRAGFFVTSEPPTKNLRRWLRVSLH